jgi:type I thyroxine 5'-deiodinase
VYILEAHASDVWQMPSNIKQNIVFASPRSIEERTAVADSCVRNLHIEIPALLDGFRDATEAAYTGWPDRLYLIDRDGRVAYKSGPGPFGFHPQELQAALTRMLD